MSLSLSLSHHDPRPLSPSLPPTPPFTQGGSTQALYGPPGGGTGTSGLHGRLPDTGLAMRQTHHDCQLALPMTGSVRWLPQLNSGGAAPTRRL